MKPEGTLNIKTVFTISGRGVCVAGDIVEGEVNVGMVIQPLLLGNEKRTLRVAATGFLDKTSGKGFEIGLLFETGYTKQQIESALGDTQFLYCYEQS